MTAGFCFVPSGSVAVVERSGTYRRTLDPGFSLLVPFLDKVTVVSLREQVVSGRDTAVVTTDELVVTLDWNLYVEVTDAKTVTSERPGYLNDLWLQTGRIVREVVSAMDMEQALTSRAEIHSAVRRKLEWATAAWGVQVHRFEILDMRPPPGFLEAREAQREPSEEP